VTLAGAITVSNVVASSYVALLDDVSPRTLNRVSHAILGLHRMMCALDFDLCQDEIYNENGINTYIASFVQIVMVLNQQSSIIQMALCLFLLPLLAIFVLVYILFLPLFSMAKRLKSWIP
jgi:hypothetical protein